MEKHILSCEKSLEKWFLALVGLTRVEGRSVWIWGMKIGDQMPQTVLSLGPSLKSLFIYKFEKIASEKASTNRY